MASEKAVRIASWAWTLKPFEKIEMDVEEAMRYAEMIDEELKNDCFPTINLAVTVRDLWASHKEGGDA